MDISKEIKIMDLQEKYQREIFGLGEIYEIMSVEKIRKKLLKKYHQGKLYLASNKEHSGRGVTLKELEDFFSQNENAKIKASGFADSPPWSSAPLNPEQKKIYNKFLILISKIIFWFLIKLEFIWKGKKQSHMIFLFSQK